MTKALIFTTVFLASVAILAGAAETPQLTPPTNEVLELRKALVDAQMQNLQLNYQMLQRQKQEIEEELAKRKAAAEKK